MSATPAAVAELFRDIERYLAFVAIMREEA